MSEQETDLLSLLSSQQAATAAADAEIVDISSQLERYSVLSKRLSDVSSRFRSDQLLGLTSKCLVRGTVRHSAEVTLRLGGGEYYAETSAQNALKVVEARSSRLTQRLTVCQARRSAAEENCRLLKEFCGSGITEDGGGGGRLRDIKEPLTEEAESKWAAEHRAAVRREKLEERAKRQEVLLVRKREHDSLLAHFDKLEKLEMLEYETEKSSLQSRAGAKPTPCSATAPSSTTSTFSPTASKSPIELVNCPVVVKSKSVSFAAPEENKSRVYCPHEPPNVETMRQRTITFSHTSLPKIPTQFATSPLLEAGAGSGELAEAPLFTSPGEIGSVARAAQLKSAQPAVRDRVVESQSAVTPCATPVVAKSEERPVSKFRQQRMGVKS